MGGAAERGEVETRWKQPGAIKTNRSGHQLRRARAAAGGCASGAAGGAERGDRGGHGLDMAEAMRARHAAVFLLHAFVGPGKAQTKTDLPRCVQKSVGV